MSGARQFHTTGEGSAGPHELLIRMKNGEQHAWEELYEQLQEPLTCYLKGRYYPIREEEVEDIFVDAMIAVMIHAATYHGSCDQQARSWIYHIARNLTIDALRSAKHIVAETDPERENDLHAPIDDHPSDYQKSFQQLVAILTPQEKQILKKTMEGKNASAIAAELGVSPAWISAIKKKIRTKGRQFFQPSED